MISEEPFMKFFREKKIVDMLKVRASYGEIGSDQLGPDPFDSSRRWLYMNQWLMADILRWTLIRRKVFIHGIASLLLEIKIFNGEVVKKVECRYRLFIS